MELKGAQLCFSHLKERQIMIKVFVSDQHKGIAKWIREWNPSTIHYFDQWHIAKNISKKMFAASRQKGCELIADWIQAVKNHVYWCSTSTKEGFQSMILAKWKSLIRHISDCHSDHPDGLFTECAHGDIEPREWIKKGEPATVIDNRHFQYHISVYYSSYLAYIITFGVAF